MTYPEELTADLSVALGTMPFHTGPIAHIMRLAGHNIPRKAEDEQAFVLHWLTTLVLKEGREWGRLADEQIKRWRFEGLLVQFYCNPV